MRSLVKKSKLTHFVLKMLLGKALLQSGGRQGLVALRCPKTNNGGDSGENVFHNLLIISIIH